MAKPVVESRYYVFDGGILSLRVGTYRALIENGAFCPDGRCDGQTTASAHADSYMTLVDSGVSQILFPTEVYNVSRQSPIVSQTITYITDFMRVIAGLRQLLRRKPRWSGRKPHVYQNNTPRR